MRFLLLLSVLCLVLAPLAGRAAGDDHAVNDAAYVLAFGRVPSANEVDSAGAAPANLAACFGRLAQQLRSDGALQQAVAVKAFQDAFGRSPSGADASTLGQGSYVELMRRHVGVLSAQPAAYEDVIRRAYPLVIHREVYAEEIAYWKKRGTVPFALLVAAIEDWARRNQPGLMVTAGAPTVSVNSEFLTTVRLSPAVAEEARAAAQLPPAVGTDRAPHHLIAAGGETLVTGGGIYFVAAGRSDLVK